MLITTIQKKLRVIRMMKVKLIESLNKPKVWKTVAKWVKLNPWKRKKQERESKFLTSNKLFTRLPVSLAQIKAENNS